MLRRETAQPFAPHRRLDAVEWRRKIWHIGPGFLPFILWVVPHHDPLSALEIGIILVLVGSLCASFLALRKSLIRDEESSLVTPLATYAAVFLLPLLLFPARAELAMSVVAIVAFGDGAATIGGRLLGGPRLPWNRCKTWSGLASFVIIAGPLATITYWAEAQPAVAVSTSVWCTALAVAGAGLAESLDSPIDDNLRVGLTSLAILLPLSVLVSPLATVK